KLLHRDHNVEEAEQMLGRYRHAFSHDFKDLYPDACILQDIEYLRTLEKQGALAAALFPASQSDPGLVWLSIYHRGEALALSKILPMLESLGFEVLSESTHLIK